MAPVIAVVDYGIGNMHSIHKALVACGADARRVVSPAAIAAADAVVLPGVGAFGACMAALDSSGLLAPTVEAAADGRPFLGVCVGMQLLFDGSDEAPGVAGLGVISGRVRPISSEVKRPQMQWNRLDRADDPMFDGLARPIWMYFVHSFHAVPADASTVVATCDYGGSVTAAVRRGNVFATQFHPEKSARAGLELIENFVRWVMDR